MRDLLEVDFTQIQTELARFCPRLLEQLLYERREPIDLRQHLWEKQIGRFIVGRFDDRFEHQFDRRERCAQLVRDVGEKLAARAQKARNVGLIVGKNRDSAAVAFTDWVDRNAIGTPLRGAGNSNRRDRRFTHQRVVDTPLQFDVGNRCDDMRPNRARWIEVENYPRRPIGKTDARVTIDEHDAERERRDKPRKIGLALRVLVGMGRLERNRLGRAARTRQQKSYQRPDDERCYDQQNDAEHGSTT
jgi:hypothetical protein